jgi:hypothetical protein
MEYINQEENIEHTRELLLKALDSPNLATTVTCRYVSSPKPGVVKHCIVGEVLSLIGVSDKKLRGRDIDAKGLSYTPANQKPITERDDLDVNSLGLDEHFLREAQVHFDSGKKEDFMREFIEAYKAK